MTTDLRTLAARLEALEAREAIREVLNDYARGVDREDLELLRSCYHPDAVDVHWTFIGNAHEFAQDVIDKMGGLPNKKHYITNAAIELDGERAFVESSFLATQRIPLDGGRVADLQAEGRYLDVFERREGVWRIAHRHMVTEKTWSVVGAAPPTVGAGRPVPDERQRSGKFPDDPVYRGFGITALTPPEYRHEGDLYAAIRDALG